MPEMPFKTGRARLLMASILGFLAAMGPLCTDLYLPALPQMMEQLDCGAAQVQLSITFNLLGLALGQIFLGPVSDAKGRKVPLLFSLLLFIAASFLCAVARNVGQLIALRFIQGLAGSGGVVLSRAIACDLYRGTELTRFFSLLMLVNSAAPIFGPVIGGQIMRISGWSGIFFFLALCGAAQLALVFFKYGETLPPEKRIGGGLAVSLRNMAKLFQNRLYLCYLLIQGFVMAGFFGYIAASPFVLQKIYGLSAQQYSLCFAANGMGIMLFAQMTGRVCREYGDRRVLGFGCWLSFFSAVLLACACVFTLSVWWMLGALWFFSSSMGIISTTSFSLAIASQDGGAGGASGLLGVAGFVFGAFASPVVGLCGEMSSLPLAAVAVGSSALVLAFYAAAGRLS